MLSDSEWTTYLDPLDPAQRESVAAIRNLIAEAHLNLDEAVETGKWWTGLLVYSTVEKVPVFALGPLSGGFTTFHMMPYYGSAELQSRHGTALRKFLSGKSCIKFKSADQLPLDSLKDIISCTPKFAEMARAMSKGKKKGSDKTGAVD